jgi:hypothetical protein
MQHLFELDTGKFNLVSIAPWQARWLIAKAAVPSQRCLQRETSLLQERDNVVRLSPLFGNANSQESHQYPAEKRESSGGEEVPNFYKKDSD